MFCDTVAVVLVDSGYDVTDVVCFKKSVHFFVQVFCTLVRTKGLGMGPKFGD